MRAYMGMCIGVRVCVRVCVYIYVDVWICVCVEHLIEAAMYIYRPVTVEFSGELLLFAPNKFKANFGLGVDVLKYRWKFSKLYGLLVVDARRFKYVSYAELIVVDFVLLNQFFVVLLLLLLEDDGGKYGGYVDDDDNSDGNDGGLIVVVK